MLRRKLSRELLATSRRVLAERLMLRLVSNPSVRWNTSAELIDEVFKLTDEFLDRRDNVRVEDNKTDDTSVTTK